MEEQHFSFGGSAMTLRPPAPEPQNPKQNPPPIFDPNLFPSRHRPWKQWLADHNPCLLLSTVFMLLGCYLVSSALRDQSANLKILALLGVINLYEACIIPLGLVLIRRTRGTARDGWWLVLFETLFLVNATFINPDFGMAWAIPLNLGLWVLACLKAGILLRGLKIGLSLRTFGFLALQLGIIYALPVFFALTKVDGVEPPRLMYGLWWLVGLLPVVYDLLARAERPHPPWDLVQNVIRRVYLIAPWVMLVAHMGFSHWAHHSDFYLADVAPPLLGLAIASRRVHLRPDMRLLARSLPAVALLLTLLAAPGELQWLLPLGEEGRMVAPAHFTIAATILTYGYLASAFYFVCSALTVMVVGLGYTLQSWILAAIRAAARFLMDLLPATAYAWGVTAIFMAFVLLGIGTYLSLQRTRKETPA
jgi:hypothetical protein